MTNFLLAFLVSLVRTPFVTLMKGLGVAFGPDDVTLLALKSKNEIDNFFAQRPNLSRTHNDWISILSWVPREYTIWLPGPVFPQPILMGNTSSNKPIPVTDEWWVGRGYLAGTFDIFGKNVHARFGFRPDDVDAYYAISFTIKIV